MSCKLHKEKMRCLISSFPSLSCSITDRGTKIAGIAIDARVSISLRPRLGFKSRFVVRSQSSPSDPKTHEEGEFEGEGGRETLVQELKVPDQWLVPSKALEESEWLRTSLLRWLDDEYCPEPTNTEISQVAARSYYESLQERETDLGVILLKMARELETISYQDSFHGAFSSANAAVSLIVERIDEIVD